MKIELDAEVFMSLWKLVGMTEAILYANKIEMADKIALELNEKLKAAWDSAKRPQYLCAETAEHPYETLAREKFTKQGAE